MLQGGLVRPLSAVLLPLLVWDASAQTYNLLATGIQCSTVGGNSITSSATCFGDAKTALGLTTATTATLNDFGFTGCVYNAASDVVYFGTSSSFAPGLEVQYVCEGILDTSTTSTSATSTGTTATVTTSTSVTSTVTTSTSVTSTVSTSTITTLEPTTTVLQNYSLLDAGELCASFQLPDITGSTECFSFAAPFTGLSVPPENQQILGGFGGCVYQEASNVLISSATGDPSAYSGNTFFRFICRGTATTTTTTSSSTTVTTTTLSSTTTVTQTSTVTSTSTTSTSTTVTSSTSTTTSLTSTTTSSVSSTTSSSTTITSTTSSSVTSTATTVSTSTTSSTATTTTYTGSTTVTTVTSTTSSTDTSSTSTLTTTSSSSSTISTTSTSSTTASTTTSVTSTTSSSTTDTSTTSTLTTSTVTTETTTVTVDLSSLGSAGFVGDDPLTVFGDTAQQFFLPEDKLVQLLSTPEMRLLGSAVGLGSEQWINHLAVTGPQGEPVLRLAIRSDIESYQPEGAPSDAFSTLNVTLDWLGGVPLKAIPPPDAFAYTWGSVVFAFGRLPHFKVGRAPAEVVVIEGTSARIVVTSIEAGGFGGDQAHLAVKYAHLDFVLHVKQQESCAGVLPELWGFKPLSNETLAMTEAH